MQLPDAPDRLLSFARLLIHTCRAILWIGVAALLVAVPFLYHGREDMLLYMGREGTTISAHAMFALVATALVGIAIMLYLGTRFLRQLLAFTGAVALGDPFIAANAARLRVMAWLLLSMEFLGLALWLYEQWGERYTKDLDIGFSMSLSSIIAVVTLFVLARIFTVGAAMRDDLEGTV